VLTYKEKIMEEGNWLVGWREIGKYIGRSAKTAQRWAREGMPFFRDPGKRPVALPWQINEWLFELNQEMHDKGIWKDKGIQEALWSLDGKEKAEKEFKERLIEAQRPPRGRF
jgi:hypothetical protein